jgi:predicted  nucleic acid-binding Zn-ribbon protein
MEDDVLMLLDRHEELETAVAAATRAVASAEVTIRSHEAEVDEAWKRIDAEIARKESRKEAIVPLIEPEILELYEALRAHKEGVGAARLADGVCGGCHLTLSPAELLEVLNEDPPRCLHCRRILVV